MDKIIEIPSSEQKKGKSNKAKITDYSQVSSPFTRYFWIFGFEISDVEEKRSIPKLICKIILRLIPLIFVYTSIKLNMACVNTLLKGRRSTRTECQPITLRTNITDLFFGLFCYFTLICHEKRIGKIFHKLGNDVFEIIQDKVDGKAMTKSKVTNGCRTFFMFVLCIAATLGLISATKFASMTIGRKSSVAKKIYEQTCNLPFRILSTMFSILFALACNNLRFFLKKMVEMRENCSNLDEYESHYRKIRRLILEINIVFSDILPLLYLCRMFSMAFWLEFLMTQTTLLDKIKLIAFLLHLLQSLCILMPAISVNNLLKESLEIGNIGNMVRNKESTRGAYIPSYSNDSASPEVNLMMLQMMNSQPRLMAGNVPINTWIVTAAVFLSWLLFEFGHLSVATSSEEAEEPKRERSPRQPRTVTPKTHTTAPPPRTRKLRTTASIE